MKKYSKTTYLVLCGLFAALMAICSFITIPLGFTPVPLNLGTMGVFLCGGILGAKYGTVSEVVYVLLGAAGIPVFAGFKGGLGVLAGPTGGYIIGYIAAAFLIGFILDKYYSLRQNNKNSDADKCSNGSGITSVKPYMVLAGSMLLGLAACYALGTLWFVVSTGTGLWASLVACVFPFIPGDIVKIAAGTLLVKKLRPLLR